MSVVFGISAALLFAGGVVLSITGILMVIVTLRDIYEESKRTTEE